MPCPPCEATPQDRVCLALLELGLQMYEQHLQAAKGRLAPR